jgi:hypothetical protein
VEPTRDDHAQTGKRRAAPATDQAILLYSCVDCGDMDGFTSLLSGEIRIMFPADPPARGKRAAEELARTPLTERGRHLIHWTRNEDGNVVVDGSFTDTNTRRSTRFTDSLTFSEQALITSWNRSYSSYWLPSD